MNRDKYLFSRAGLADIYDVVGGYNLFMECDNTNASAFREPPRGYAFRLCRRDELEKWKNVVAEARYADFVADYYEKVYAKREAEFFDSCTFAVDVDDKPVASCFLWRAYGKVNSIAWFRVLPECEGKGIGRALLTKLMKSAECPIYLHTQPSSVCAIKLYSDFGYKLITNPYIGYRKNFLPESLPYMRKVMNSADFNNLQFVEAGAALLSAALTSETAEL